MRHGLKCQLFLSLLTAQLMPTPLLAATPAEMLTSQPPAKVLKAERKRNDYKGLLEKPGFTFNGCGVESFKVSYSLFVLLGEGAINGAFSWQAAPGTAADCLKPDTVFALKFEGSKKRVAYATLRPTVPKAGAQGWNVAGSPNWNQMFWSLDDQGHQRFWTDTQARNFWRAGMRVVDFIVLDRDREQAMK